MPRLKNEGKTIPIPRLLLIISIKDFRVYLFQSIPDGPIKVKKPKRLKRRSTVSPRNQSGRSVKAQNNLLSCQCRLFSYSAQTGNKKEALIPALPFCLDISCFELNGYCPSASLTASRMPLLELVAPETASRSRFCVLISSGMNCSAAPA